MLIFPSFFNAAAGGYEIEQSLRFSGASTQYLYRTGAITAQGGVSLWVKFHRDVGAYTAGVYDPIIYLSGGGPWLYRNNYGYLYYRSISSGGDSTWSAQRTRDHSAWYHIFLKFNSSNSTSLYVNNVLWGTKTANIGTSSSNQRVGYDGTYRAQYYLAEYHAAFGESLDPTDFGEYDANGVWVPKKFTGNYGSQGFYLKFDPSAANGLGHDHSGNGNHFTDAGGFTTSGTGTDVMSDTPTTNWCVMNPNDRGDSNTTLSNGNLSFAATSPWDRGVKGTFAVSSGKWYWEYTHGTISAGSQPGADLGITKYTSLIVGGPQGGATSTDSYILAAHDGDLHNGSYTGSSYGSSANSGDVISIALDLDNGKIWWAKNGTWFNSGNPASGTNAGYTGLSGTFFPLWYWGISPGTGGVNAALGFNFGQRDFAYTPPTDFLSLNTSNLPAPTVKDGSDYFNTILWAGDNANPRTLTGVGFQPDWVWLKDRTQSTNHRLVDAVRGAGNTLKSNNTSSETSSETAGTITAFTSDGFTVEGTSNVEGVNLSGDNFVAWNWLSGGSGSSNTDGSITSTVSVNATAGFSIVSYTAENAVRTIGHGLGVAPKFIIVKDRDATSNWAVYHASMGNTKAIYLDLNLKTDTNSGYWNNTSPTSTVFTVGTNTRTGGSTNDYIAYCFAEVEGYSKIGSYTGNGSSDGPFIYTGFRPAFILFKNYAGGSEQSWTILDNTRDTYNAVQKTIYPDIPNAEDGTVSNVDFCSNGFKLRNTWQNEGSSDHLYIAFAENPFGGSGVSPATAR